MRLAKKVFAFALALSLTVPSVLGMGAIAEGSNSLKVTKVGEGSVIVRDDSGQHAVKENGYEGMYAIGDSVTLSIKADEGNSIKAIEVNGKSLEGVSDGLKEATYKYKISKESQSIAVSFTGSESKKVDTADNSNKAASPSTSDTKGNESTANKESKNSSKKSVIAFENIENISSLYLDKDEKGTTKDVLDKLPDKLWFILEGGEYEQVDVTWECSDDFENTEYELYTFQMVMPEGYELGGDLTEWDIPYFDVYVGATNPNAKVAFKGNPNGKITIDQKFGIDGADIISWLTSHEKDKYYIGTPYLDKVFEEPYTDWLRANGATGGKGSMNCTGFVADVFRKCGANLLQVTKRRPGHYVNASNWHDYVNGYEKQSNGTWAQNLSKACKTYRYDCTVSNGKITDSAIQKALRDGKMKKGDIIYFEPTNWSVAEDQYGNTVDCHIGFFWGEKTGNPADYNKFWNSTHKSAGVEGSNSVTNIGNQISQLVPKSEPYIMYVYPLSRMGSINLTKVSGNTSVTNGNGQYSFEGAEYTVKNSSNKVVGTIKTDKSGKGSLGDLPYGTYTVKETKAPKGYALDPKTYTVTINDANAESGVSVTSKDYPLLDPMVLILRKQDSTNGNSTPSGHASLAGAEFTVKYYSVQMSTDPAENGYKAHRTWVFRTDSKGQVKFSEDYKVSGDDFYLDSTGQPSVPYGTLTIQETKAPEGYLLNSNIFCTTITKDHGASGTIVTNPATVPENTLDLVLTKVHDDTSKVIKGAVFEHTRPNGQTERFTTDSTGKIKLVGLERGVHSLKEVSAPDGYAVNGNVIKFRVQDDNSVDLISSGTETDLNGSIVFKNEATGNVSVTVNDKPAPFKLKVHKINNKNLVLEGAEFTLYSDKACKNAISKGTTDGKGDLIFEDLIAGKTYYVKETKAPAGYRIPVNDDGSAIVYEIKAESVPVDGVFKFYVNGKAYTSNTGNFCVEGTKADRIGKITVVNEIGLKLPNTGSALMIPIMGAGAVLMGIALVVSKKRRKL